MASVSLLEARVQQFVWKHPREKNTVVSVSGKSVTITPKKDGDTINSICALINAHTSATTLMSAMGVGDTTTKMTTSLGTTSLVGGEVRIYDPVTVAGFSGTGSFIIRSDTDDAKWDRNLGTIISTATSNGVLFHNNNMRISLKSITVEYTGSTSTLSGIQITTSPYVDMTCMTISGG